jgi:hypothetical protein
MTKGTKIGLVVALVGLFIPIISLPFTTNQRPTAGFVYNIANMGVVLYKGRAPEQPSASGSAFREGVVYPKYTELRKQVVYKGRIEFPYKYCFFLGSILFCSGLCIALAYHQRKQKRGD